MYNYFQSKEDMIISLFEDLVLTIKNDITNNFKQTGDYKNDFFELFILHSKFIRQNPKTNKLFDYFSFSPYLKHKVKYDICYEITLFVNNFIQKGQNDGFITKVFDSLSIKKMIISCIKGFFDNWSPDETQHQVSDEEISNLITLIWNMISI
jgi:AcrR family transcriptional regulator